MRPVACLRGIGLEGDDSARSCPIELRARNGAEQDRLPEQHKVNWENDRKGIDAHPDAAHRDLAQEVETFLAGKNRHPAFFAVPH